VHKELGEAIESEAECLTHLFMHILCEHIALADLRLLGEGPQRHLYHAIHLGETINRPKVKKTYHQSLYAAHDWSNITDRRLQQYVCLKNPRNRSPEGFSEKHTREFQEEFKEACEDSYWDLIHSDLVVVTPTPSSSVTPGGSESSGDDTEDESKGWEWCRRHSLPKAYNARLIASMRYLESQDDEPDSL
jgi:hypothetical protein